MIKIKLFQLAILDKLSRNETRFASISADPVRLGKAPKKHP